MLFIYHTKSQKSFLTSLVILSCIELLGACSEESVQKAELATPKVASSYASTHKTLLVGSEVSYIPFEFKDEQGQPNGFEVDLLKAVAKAESFNVQFVHNKRSEMVNKLNNNTYQIWASALSISPEHLEQMDMTEPFLDFERALLVLDTPKNSNLKQVFDFKGKNISTNKSSTSNIKQITELGANPVLSESFFLSLSAVYDGKADAVMGDSRVLQYYQNKNHDIKTRIISVDPQKKHIGFAVKKGNTELLNKLNSGLAKVKADGTFDKLTEKWFGKMK